MTSSNRLDLEARLRALREPKRTATPTVVSSASSPSVVPSTAAAVVIGPQYDEAIRIAQFAIESERKRFIHTAIDAYIQAGQRLIHVGRDPSQSCEFQLAIRRKALALLERAEALSGWADRIKSKQLTTTTATADQDDVLRTAYEASQRKADQEFDAKAKLVTQLQSDNQHMQQQVNKLAVLTRVKSRFRRLLSGRRAQRHSSASISVETSPHDEITTATKPESPQEQQKRMLINELHARIGLPEIDHFRDFKPLSVDEERQRRHEQLEQELLEARQEAERLRNAVKELTDALEEVAMTHSGDSAEDTDAVAQLKQELAQVKDELALVRQRSSSYGKRNNESFLTDSEDEFEDQDMMERLRTSLHKTEKTGNNDKRPQIKVRRASMDHDSPRHHPLRKPSSSDSIDQEADGGIWL